MDKIIDFSILFTKGLEIAPRIISHQDRNVLSPNFGYFGRKHWAWKTSAFPDASNQYALYYLALIWYLEDYNNSFYHNDNILEWISAGISRWSILQNKDGSFNQVFPNEHSVGATSYTLLAILEANKILGNYLDNTVKSCMTNSIERAGKFLLLNNETYGIISNHLALYATTFNELWKLTGREEYKNKCKEQINIILDNMSSEGWFKEYEGADPGYMTQCIYYLVRLMDDGYAELKNPIHIAIKDYLPYFIHPDGSTGGHYGSRNTSIFYPAGIALLYTRYIEAREILLCMCKGILKGNTPSPASLDFSNSFRLASNYLIAWACIKISNHSVNSHINKNDYCLPCSVSRMRKEFPDAGMVTVGTSSYHAVLGTKKGGVLKIFNKKSGYLNFEDHGYIANVGNKYITTQKFYNSDFVKISNNKIKLIHPFFISKLYRMSPLKYIFILFMGITLFRLKFVREAFKKSMVRYLITKKDVTKVFYEREITFEEDKVIIRDEIRPPKGKYIKNLKSGINFSTIHMASSDYFEFSNLNSTKKYLIPYVNDAGIKIHYEIPFLGEKTAQPIWRLNEQ